MASTLTSARPPATAIAWATKDSIMVEFPTRDGAPYLTRFPKTAAGLASALSLILEAPAPTRSVIEPAAHPAIRRPKPIFDEAEREAARAALKKAGII